MIFRDRANKSFDHLALAAIAVLALSPAGCQERMEDLPWHLKTGEWILAHRTIPTTDFFSFTRQGLEWLDAQWLFQVIACGAYHLLGAAGPAARARKVKRSGCKNA